MQNFVKYFHLVRGILFLLLVVAAVFGVKHHLGGQKIERKVSNSNLLIP